MVLSWRADPTEINKGHCEEFAMTVIRKLGGCSDALYEMCTQNVDPKEQMDLPYHVWIFCNGRHYDSESPDGVDNWRELPIFTKFEVCGEE